MLLEASAACSGGGAVVVIAGHGNSREGLAIVQPQQPGGVGQLGLKSQCCRIPAENNVIWLAPAQLSHQRGQHLVRAAEAEGPAQNAQIQPRGKALIEPVLALPAQRPARDVNVAEMSQAHGSVVRGHAHRFLLSTMLHSIPLWRRSRRRSTAVDAWPSLTAVCTI